MKRARATRAMGKRNANSRPRAVGGGRSARYDERRGASGSQKQYASEWSDASAAVVLQQLQKVCNTHGDSMLSGTLKVLQSDELERSFLRELRGKLSPHDEGIATEVLALHRERVRAAGAEDKKLKALAKSFLKPLRERASARSKKKELKVKARSDGPATFHGWLATDPSKERMRKISKSQRILRGVARWPLGWLESDGVVCYERAAGRVAQERKGKPDAEFMKGVVKTQNLPTAVASGPRKARAACRRQERSAPPRGRDEARLRG